MRASSPELLEDNAVPVAALNSVFIGYGRAMNNIVCTPIVLHTSPELPFPNVKHADDGASYLRCSPHFQLILMARM